MHQTQVNSLSITPSFDPALHGGGLTETQREERVVAYDEAKYGFVRMAAMALQEAGAVTLGGGQRNSSPIGAHVCVGSRNFHRNLEKLHLSASSRALSAIGPKNNPFVAPLQNTLRKSDEFQSALHAFVKHEVCPALGVNRVVYQRRPTFRVHLVGYKGQMCFLCVVHHF